MAACSAPMLLAGSPRAGGNSDLVAQELGRAVSPSPHIYYLREHHITPCTGCEVCSATSFKAGAEQYPFVRCPLGYRDESRPLLEVLAHAPLLFITSPIYNYHLPAGLKALLDRLQPFWAAQGKPLLDLSPGPAPTLQEAVKENIDAGIPPEAVKLKTRPCFPVLVAGRTRGEKLFAGSLLTLKYALAPLGFVLQEPLCLRGLDAKGDLAAQPQVLEQVREYGKQAAELAFALAEQEHPAGGL